MTLEDGIRHFTRETRSLASLSVSFGNGHDLLTLRDGPVASDTLYDLASLSKLFTCLCVLRLWEQGKLTPDSPIVRYAPQFVHLGDITVEQVLGFSLALQTPERIDAQSTRQQGLNALFDVAPMPHSGIRAYSDIHAMVLKYVIEGASGMKIADCLDTLILSPFGMNDTYLTVPEACLSRVSSCNGEHRLEKGRWIIRDDVFPGTVHDPKAHLLSPRGEDFCGHAGVFSCEGDMIRLAQALLDGQVVSREMLHRMAVNRTGCLLPSGEWRHFLGYQCYLRHPVQHFSEVPAYMSDEAFALSGFTGHHLSVDPVTGQFTMFLGNRVQNRLSVLISEIGKEKTDYGLDADGVGLINSPDGPVYSSVDYLYRKDRYLHNAIERKEY